MSQRWFYALLALFMPVLAGAAQAESSNLNLLADEPSVAFNNDSYLLGYQVYLARGNLAAAYFVARKAVRSQPNNPDWLKRFAQVAEWVGQPSDALNAWLSYAQKTGDKVAWDAVGRLSVGLLDDNALLVYQQQLLRRQGFQHALVDQIIQTYERLGHPIEGLTFLDGLARRNPDVYLLDAESRLAERAGQDERAIALLTQLIAHHPPQQSWVLRLAALYYLRGKFDEAWDVLHRVEPQMSVQDSGYWRVYAEISRLLHHDADALHAYQVLATSDKVEAGDLQNYVTLLQNQDGLTAARLSALLFHKFGQDNALVTALYLYEREHQLDAAMQLLESLTPAQQQRLEQNPEFMIRRAQLYWQRKAFALARADYEHGMQLAPNDVRFLQGLVAVLIDQGDQQALTKELVMMHSRAIASPQLWSLWANGWSSLEKPERALPFQQAYSRFNPNDQLALLALADNYDNQGDIETARRLRHRVFVDEKFSDAKMASLKGGQSEHLTQLRQALFAQRLAAAAPDTALDMLKQRLQQPHSQQDSVLRDLTLSWLMSHESTDRARVWVNTAYHDQPPYWVAQTLALDDEDRVKMRDLLEQHPDQLPRYDRIEAATQSDLPRLGEQMAFDSLEQHPNDDEQAKRFQYLMSRRGHWVDLQGQSMQQGILSRSGSSASWSGFISEFWRLQLSADDWTQQSHNLSQLSEPPTLKAYHATLSQISERGTWTLGSAYHDALQGYPSAMLGQSYRIESGVTLHWQADYNADASESSALMVGGMKDSLAADFNWSITGRDYLSMQASAMNFKGQTGQALGSGQVINVDLGHHFFTAPHEQTFKITATSAQFSANNQPLDSTLAQLVPMGQPATARFFVPQNYNQIGAYWDFGDYNPEVYERRWRSFGELGVTLSNTTGLGYTGRIGVHGPVLGYDRLSLSLEQSKGGQDSGNIYKQFLLTYRYFY